MYISAPAVRDSFKRLKASVQSGKSYQEKTSSLMYFLAFDILSKKENSSVIDFPPKSISRRNLALEFSRLVLLKKQNGVSQQVSELGIVSRNGRDPEKRISSNFYTVPLKKASGNQGWSPFPNRPVPLLKIGGISDSVKWGISLHPNWEQNLPAFLEDVTGNTPFTDLAVFVCRNDQLDDGITDWRLSLLAALHHKFTEKVATFWTKKIESEKLFVRHLNDESFFSPDFQQAELSSGAPRIVILRGMNKDALIKRILYLEEVLDTQSISYNK